jgi:acyl dehydratase
VSDADRPPRAERELVAFMQHEEGYEASNPIHSAAGGREYGFRDALVPGVTVYGWAVPTVMAVLGDGWIDHGWAEIALRRPTYPGDTVRAVAERTGDGTCALTVTGADAEVRLTGTAGLGDAPWIEDLLRPARLTPEPPADGPRPRLTLENAPLGEDLRPMAIEVSEDLARSAAVERLAADHPLFCGDHPRIHPAAYVNLTRLIKHTYDFAPSIHTASRIQYLRPAYAGQVVTLAARCVEAHEKRGHHYISVDGVMLGEDRSELLRVRHTVIFSVAKREPGVGDAPATDLQAPA